MAVLELKHLSVFLVVVEQGSISAAARELSYTQPAVSQQIAVLERQAGMPLLERTPQGVRPTEAGRALVSHAEKLLAGAELASSELQAIAAGEGGRIRVACFPTAAAALMPAAVAAFIEAHAGVELSVIEAETEEALEMLATGSLEIAVLAERPDATDPFGAEYDDVDLTPLLKEPRYALLHPDHPLSRRARLRLEQLAEETRVELGRNPSAQQRRLQLVNESDEPSPRVAFRSDDINVVQGMVAAGAGVAVVPELALANVRSDLAVRPLGRSAPTRPVAAARRRGIHHSPASDSLLAILQRIARERRRPHESGRTP